MAIFRIAFAQPVLAALVLALIGVAAPPLRAASGEAREVEELVVTGARGGAPSVAAPVFVLDREAIAELAAIDLVDALRAVPGLHIDRDGARGSRANLHLRGADPNHTLVLLDGVRLNDSTGERGGSFDLQTLDLASVERIEVLRGPVSAFYGSDAIAGVVHIITRGGAGPPAAELQWELGRWLGARMSARVSGQSAVREGAALALTGSYERESNPGFPSEYEGLALHGVADTTLPAAGSLRATLRFVDADEDAFPGSSGGPDDAVLRELERRRVREVSTSLAVEFPLEALGGSVGFDAAVAHRKERRNSPGVSIFGGAIALGRGEVRDNFTRYSALLHATARPFSGLRATLGGEVIEEVGESEGEVVDFSASSVSADFDLTRTTLAVFGEVAWEPLRGVALDAALRIDDPDGAKLQVTPRAGVAFSLGQLPGKLRLPLPRGTSLVLRGAWGEGFKLPSFFSLANPTVGNANLALERSQGWESGFDLALQNEQLLFSASYFDREVEDLIDFDAATSSLINRNRSKHRGFEAGASLRPEGAFFDLSGHLSYTINELSDRARLRDRPRWRGGAALGLALAPHWRAVVEVLAVGKLRADVFVFEQRTLAAYERVDLAIHWQPSDAVRISLAVDNLTDAEYEESPGFPSVGVRPRVSALLRF